MIQTLFLVISALGLLAAVGTVLAPNLVHAALYLIAFFFIVACQFVLLEAEFLAAIQVLVYIGAVAILMMFGIMLTRNVQGDDTTTVSSGWYLPALVAGLALFVVLMFGIDNHEGLGDRENWKASKTRPPLVRTKGESDDPRTRAVNDMGRVVGNEMMTRFVVPFEAAGLLLTAALVGAIAVAFRKGDEQTPLIGPSVTWPHGATEGDGPGDGRAATRTESLSPTTTR